MQRGLILAYLAETPADHARAAEQIGENIPRLPETIRDSGWMAWWRVQAARARTSAGDVDEAVTGLLVALRVVDAAGAEETRREIHSLWRSLARRWPRRVSVMELGEALRR